LGTVRLAGMNLPSCTTMVSIQMLAVAGVGCGAGGWAGGVDGAGRGVVAATDSLAQPVMRRTRKRLTSIAERLKSRTLLAEMR